MSKKIQVAVLTPDNSIKGSVVLDYISAVLPDLNNSFEFSVWTKKNNTPRSFANFEFCCRDVNSYELDDKEDVEALRKLDILVVCGWGKLISKDAILAPRLASLNCHSSYLPDYKGGSVYNHQWANCEKYGGASIHFLTDRFDSGNIIAQERFIISFFDRPKNILQKASELTGPLILRSLHLVVNEEEGVPQVGGRYFRKISRRRIMLYRVYNMLVGNLVGKRIITPFVQK